MRCSRLFALSLLSFSPACSLPQAPECAQYVACQAEYDAAFGIDPPTPTSDYAPDGKCWIGNVETATRCTQSCEDGVAALDEAATLAGESLESCSG